MKIKPLKHCRLSQMKFFYWDPKDDPREPEYWEDSPLGESFLLRGSISSILCFY